MSFHGTEAFGLFAACPGFHGINMQWEKQWDRHTVSQREEGAKDVLHFWEGAALTGGEDWQTVMVARKQPGNTLIRMTNSTLCRINLRNSCCSTMNSCIECNTIIHGDKPRGCSRNLSHSFQISSPLVLLLKTFKKSGSVGWVFGVSNLVKL
jgi:hypothetical protein